MTEIRCVKCKRLLFKIIEDDWKAVIEIKCPKCSYKSIVKASRFLSMPTITFQDDKGKMLKLSDRPVPEEWYRKVNI